MKRLASIFIVLMLFIVLFLPALPVGAVGTLDIVGAQVFSSVAQSNDWLICIYYSNEWDPPFPTGTPSEYFDIELDTGGINAKIPQPDWGYKPTWIYLNADFTDTLTWQGAYDINVIGKTSKYALPVPSGTYALQAADWKGTNKDLIDTWVRTTAQAMEVVYGLDYYTEAWGGETWPAGQGVLTPLGSDTFLKGMPGLDTLRPDLFTVAGSTTEYQAKTFAKAYQGTLDWEVSLGPDIKSVVDDGGTLVNVNGRVIVVSIVFVLYVGMIGAILSAVPEPQFAVIAALPVPFFGLWAGIIDWVFALIIAAVIVILFFYVLWLRAT